MTAECRVHAIAGADRELPGHGAAAAIPVPPRRSAGRRAAAPSRPKRNRLVALPHRPEQVSVCLSFRLVWCPSARQLLGGPFDGSAGDRTASHPDTHARGGTTRNRPGSRAVAGAKLGFGLGGRVGRRGAVLAGSRRTAQVEHARARHPKTVSPCPCFLVRNLRDPLSRGGERDQSAECRRRSERRD